MKALVVQGVLMVIGVQLAALFTGQRQALLWAVSIAVAVPLAGIRRLLTTGSGAADAAEITDSPGELLRQWLSATEARIRWAESTRADWDRRWRPILAGQFEVSTGQGRSKNPAVFAATGAMMFGDELWPWVDPGNIAPTGDRSPGPGREVLQEILSRLEQR